jgi:hypothetical protein
LYISADIKNKRLEWIGQVGLRRYLRVNRREGEEWEDQN